MSSRASLVRRVYFSAGIRLWNPEWDAARNQGAFGKLAFPHGHDYVASVWYSGEIGAEDGMILNLLDLKPVLAEAVAPLDGHFLHAEVPFFSTRRATAENIVDCIWRRLPATISNGRLARVSLEESSRLRAEKTEGAMRITRSYEFAAAHRLHVPSLSDGDNQSLYGKCNNAAGHGHNFGLEVTVEGEPDPDTGAIVNLAELDAIVDEEVYEPFDHKHLNNDCADFRELIPTTENLALVIFRRLGPRVAGPGRRLAKVGLRETMKNYFEVEA